MTEKMTKLESKQYLCTQCVKSGRCNWEIQCNRKVEECEDYLKRR
nr:MAG: hypothetical protein [Helarchaeota virus Nidhogg Meg22_1012]